ncbi:MAG: SUMF1/EgtB/PvdO family nonheme iron enzyme [Bacteroidales bacterium]|jgi:hypothetical protein|nr:SUMF1/EgtB/PvdO family nonheme iron enzyme [Bacteroidales bacterium]
MKRILFFAVITVFFGVLFTNCKKEEKITLSVDKSAISAIATEENYFITVTSNGSWSAIVNSNAKSWCKIAPISAPGNGTITVSISENRFSNKRLATITISVGDITKEVIVTQQAAIFGEPEMVAVSGGTTTINGTEITISSFQIGKYEVTQKMWYDVMGSWQGTTLSAPIGEGDDFPVYNISHNEVQSFLNKLNQMTGKNYRLPTETEWEYAAKGGQSSNNYSYSGSNVITLVAWFREEGGKIKHEVGKKAPNELGIYDMTGNVSEWCSDWFGNIYPTSNLTGPVNGSAHVYRGGSSFDVATSCLVTKRFYATPDHKSNIIGFRLAIN